MQCPLHLQFTQCHEDIFQSTPQLVLNSLSFKLTSFQALYFFSSAVKVWHFLSVRSHVQCPGGMLLLSAAAVGLSSNQSSLLSTPQHLNYEKEYRNCWLKCKKCRERAEKNDLTGIELRISDWKSSALTTEPQLPVKSQSSHSISYSNEIGIGVGLHVLWNSTNRSLNIIHRVISILLEVFCTLIHAIVFDSSLHVGFQFICL